MTGNEFAQYSFGLENVCVFSYRGRHFSFEAISWIYLNLEGFTMGDANRTFKKYDQHKNSSNRISILWPMCNDCFYQLFLSCP